MGIILVKFLGGTYPVSESVGILLEELKKKGIDEATKEDLLMNLSAMPEKMPALFSELVQNQKFDFLGLKKYDMALTKKILTRLDYAPEKKEVLKQAYVFCPFCLDVYLACARYGLLDEETFETARLFGFEERLQEEMGAAATKKPERQEVPARQDSAHENIEESTEAEAKTEEAAEEELVKKPPVKKAPRRGRRRRNRLVLVESVIGILGIIAALLLILFIWKLSKTPASGASITGDSMSSISSVMENQEDGDALSDISDEDDQDQKEADDAQKNDNAQENASAEAENSDPERVKEKVDLLRNEIYLELDGDVEYELNDESQLFGYKKTVKNTTGIPLKDVVLEVSIGKDVNRFTKEIWNPEEEWTLVVYASEETLVVDEIPLDVKVVDYTS